MTYVEINRTRVDGADQRYRGSLKGISDDRSGGSFAETALSHFPKASLPIHSGGTQDPSKGSDSRGQTCVYRQITHNLNYACPADGWLYGGIFKFLNHPSPGSVSKKGPAWLTELIRYKSGCSTVLIDCRRRKFLRSIGF